MAKLIVKRSITINAPAVKVWQVMTWPDAIRRWMLVEPDMQGDGPLQLGSRLHWKDEQGKVYLTGTVLTLEPLRKLALALEDISWARKAGAGEVTYALTLAETQNGTELQLVFGDLAIDPEGQQWFDAYNTSRELDAIKVMAEGRS